MAHATAFPPSALRPLPRRLRECALVLAGIGAALGAGVALAQNLVVEEEAADVFVDDGLPPLQLQLTHGLEPAQEPAPTAQTADASAVEPAASAPGPAAQAVDSPQAPTASTLALQSPSQPAIAGSLPQPPAPREATQTTPAAEPARQAPAEPAPVAQPVGAPAPSPEPTPPASAQASPPAPPQENPEPQSAAPQSAAAASAPLPAPAPAPPPAVATAPATSAATDPAPQPLSAQSSRPAPPVRALNAPSPAVASAQPGVPLLPPEALDAKGGLSLRHLLEQVVLAHPSVQAARIDIRASAEDRRAQERQRWPSMSALVENKSSNPTIGATRVLRVEQTLWDAGRVSARINEANTTLNINQARVYITVQQLSLQLIAAWQNLKSAEGRMAVAREALDRLAGYRAQMERRVQAEASPPIDLELMLSRILQTEVELNQASNARLQALTRIEQLASLSGLQQLPWAHSPLPELALVQAQADRLREVDWLDVARRHPSVEKTRQESLVARQRLDGKRAELYPQLYLRVDRPVGTINNDVAGFVGFRYTPGAGFATSVEAQALAERAASLEQTTEVAVREVSEALASDRDELQSNRGRMLALEKAVEGSRAVLESYGRQFIAGRKTWLDLLNAVRELSQNQYSLADSHAAMLAALYRLQVRMGEPVQPAP